MRLLVRCAIAWMAGILLQGWVGGGALPWTAAAAGAAGILLATGRGLALAALCLGAATVPGDDAAASPPGPQIFEGVVARPIEPLADGRLVIIDIDGVQVGDRLDGAVARAQVTDRGRVSLLPGDRVRFSGTARRPRGYLDEGAFDRARFLAARAIDLEVSARPPGIVAVDAPARWSAWRIAGLLRERAAEALAVASSGDGAALLQALVLGRRGEVSPELDDAFRKAGVAHVLSVSGLHLAAAALLFFAGARWLWLRSPWLTSRLAADRAAAIVALPATWGYTLLTGAAVATVRSLVCAAIVLGARALGRHSDALTALAVAALAILADSPLALYDASFQLSFAAAAALALVAPRLRGRGAVVRALAASAAAAVATAPLTALHFGVVQPGGVVTNLVVVPLAELVVLPVGLLAAALGALAPSLAASVTAVAGLAAGGLAKLVLLLARVAPTFEVPPPRPLELALLGAAALTLIVWPGRRPLLAAAALLTSCAVSYAWPATRAGVEVTFLDVGQGDSTVIEAPGQTWLVDAGGRLFGAATPDGPGTGPDPGEQAVWRFLAAHRTRRIDVAVVSHPHPDHYGGLAAVAQHVPVTEMWISGDDPGDARWTALVAELRARGTHVVVAGAGMTRVAGAVRLEILAGGADAARSVNDNSLVALVTLGRRRVLLTGDIEAPAEAALALPPAGMLLGADVVKVPHHGSRTSSSPELVRATRPALAVISCGAGNRFGFPARPVVAAWRAAGAQVVRTDESGAVTVSIGDDGTLSWRTRQ
jgi:competence protein ComEC